MNMAGEHLDQEKGKALSEGDAAVKPVSPDKMIPNVEGSGVSAAEELVDGASGSQEVIPGKEIGNKTLDVPVDGGSSCIFAERCCWLEKSQVTPERSHKRVASREVTSDTRQKSQVTCLSVGGCVGAWVGAWVGACIRGWVRACVRAWVCVCVCVCVCVAHRCTCGNVNKHCIRERKEARICDLTSFCT